MLQHQKTATIGLTTWLTKGTYPRLYIPIFLIILAVTTVRYHYLIRSELEEEQQRIDTVVARLSHFLVPALVGTHRPLGQKAAQDWLNSEIRFNADIASLVWQVGQVRMVASNPQVASRTVPLWFMPLVHTPSMEKAFSVSLADGQTGQLTVSIRPDASADQVWSVISAQMLISALNITLIFGVLTILLRANSRMLKRLSISTVEFQSGKLNTRMEVAGTLEARTVAATFNAMASQIEQLVTSLQDTELKQADQLHFTRQLIDSLPLPIFVRSSRNICLVVNRAWEDLFDTPAQAFVGQPMPSNFSSLDDGEIDVTTSSQDSVQQAASTKFYRIDIRGEARYMLYFKAPFTNTSGLELGTIATLVDVTERERARLTRE